MRTWFRHAGTWLLAGSLLTAACTALHPPTFDPLAAGVVLEEVRHAPQRWMAEHIGMAIGLTLWTFGWVSLYRALADAGVARWSLYGAVSAGVALALWLPLLTAEVAGLPLLARGVVGPAPAGQPPAWWAFLWPATLATGYTAALLDWTAALAAAADLLRWRPWRVWGKAGLAALLPGVPGLLAAWLAPQHALWILLFTIGPGGLWFLGLAWRLRHGMAPPPSEPPGGRR